MSTWIMPFFYHHWTFISTPAFLPPYGGIQFPSDFLSYSLKPIFYSNSVKMSSLSTPSSHPVGRLLTEWLLSSVSGLSSKTLSSTARTAHRDPGAACSCSSTFAPGSCWEGEKPRETCEREKYTWGSGQPGEKGKQCNLDHQPICPNSGIQAHSFTFILIFFFFGKV